MGQKPCPFTPGEEFDFVFVSPEFEMNKKQYHTVNVQLSPEIYARLTELKIQVEKKQNQTITYDELLEVLLNGFDFES